VKLVRKISQRGPALLAVNYLGRRRCSWRTASSWSACGERGITVGRDFAIMGFDGLLDTAHSNPPLSTVDVRPGALGEAAASLMLERLSRPDTARLRYVATPELRLRASA